MTSQTTVNQFKEAAAESAAAELRDGMIVGLGSGTTATLAVAAIGKRVKEGLRIIGIPTSEKTADQARQLNIPLATLEEQPTIDVTIDGADEVQVGKLDLIKGGGGNLLREKIVAVSSARMIVVADARKVVQKLGTFPLPIEIVPFGWKSTAKRLEALGAHPTLRLSASGNTFVTDGGNYILDCAFGLIESPESLQTQLDSVVGLVEHGLFVGIAWKALIGDTDGVRVLEKQL
jgi:ribose 5-phosphate isomerase A